MNLFKTKLFKGFTLIELIVVMAILSIIVGIAVPKFSGKTKEAVQTRLINDARILEDASHEYYIANGDWPRLNDTPLTEAELTDVMYYLNFDKPLAPDTEANYYNIDVDALSPYLKNLNTNPLNFVLQNPVGNVYILDPGTNSRLLFGSIDDPDESEGSSVPQIAAGAFHTAAITEDGTVKTWGRNNFGQLGNGTESNSSIPVNVPGLTGVKEVKVGEYHTVALMNDGTVKAWGCNSVGQLGNGTFDNSSIPVDVIGLSGVSQIAVGNHYAVALMNDGTVKTWGYGPYGQLGNGTFGTSTTPVNVTGLTGVKAVSAGSNCVVALMNDGTVKEWGLNLNDATTRSTPVDKPGLTGVKEVAIAGDIITVLMNDGTVKSWGQNNRGQFGNGTAGTTTASSTPVDAFITDVKQISITGHTVALTNDGIIKVWGSNSSGQLGNGTFGTSTIPIDVPFVLTGIKQVVAGGGNTIVIMNDGTVKAWGRNDFGQLGDGTTDFKLTPVNVIGF